MPSCSAGPRPLSCQERTLALWPFHAHAVIGYAVQVCEWVHMGAVPYIYQLLAHEFTYTPFVFCSNMLPHSMQLMCIYVCVYECKGAVPYAHGLLALEFTPICLLHLKSSATLQATSSCQTLKSQCRVYVWVCAHTCAVLCSVHTHVQFYVFTGFWLTILHQFVFSTSNLLPDFKH